MKSGKQHREAVKKSRQTFYHNFKGTTAPFYQEASMKHKSMVRQVQEALQGQLRVGESRHKAKNEENTHAPAGIFS